MADLYLGAMRFAFHAFTVLFTFGLVLLMMMGVLWCIQRVIDQFILVRAAVEISREAVRQGRGVWIKRAMRVGERRN